MSVLFLTLLNYGSLLERTIYADSPREFAKNWKGCTAKTNSLIEHGCADGDYVHIAVGARLCGSVEVGELSWIGAGAL